MPLVADIAPELIAAVALVAVLAVYFMVEALEAIARAVGMPNWPLIGGALYGAIAHVATWVGESLAWLWQNANPINMFLATTHWISQQLSNWTNAAITGVVGAAERLATVTIPAMGSFAVQTAYNLYADAKALITTAEQFAVLTAYNLYADAKLLVNDAVTAIDVTIAGVEAKVAALGGTFAAAIAAASLGLVQSLQGWVAQELGTLHTTIDGEIQAATEGISTQIGDVVQTVEGDLAPAIAAAAAVGAAAATAFKTWEQDCGDNLCNNLSGYANTIGAILGVITDGALIALLVEAVTNPQGVVDFVVSDIVDPVDQAIDTVEGWIHWPPPAKAA
jgi:hypothetical protein